MACVYRFWNCETGHYYVGATDEPHRREVRWRKEVERGGKTEKWKKALAVEKHRNQDSWRFEIVKEYETLDEAAHGEAVLLDIHVGSPLCLNAYKTTGKAATLTQEARSKVSMSNTNPSDETRQKIRKSKLGENNPMYGTKGPWYGKKRSDEDREKMRAGCKLRDARKRAKRFFDWLSDPT